MAATFGTISEFEAGKEEWANGIPLHGQWHYKCRQEGTHLPDSYRGSSILVAEEPHYY